MRAINIGLSPNTTISDFWTAFKIIFKPWTWKTGDGPEQVEDWFKNYFQTHNAVVFNAGRSALFVLLKSLKLLQGTEVMLQAFTCVAVPNCVIWADLKPVYIDVDDSLNLDIEDARKKLTPRTKVMIVQHTFGIACNLDKISAFCKNNNIFLIEDCAHALGGKIKNKLLGKYGEAAVFSFGRDKIISSVFGGCVITSNKSLGDEIKLFEKKLPYPSYFWIFQQLLHPIVSVVILYIYDFFKIGKIILVIFQKLKLLSIPVERIEKNGVKPELYPKRYPNALAKLIMAQLNNLTQNINHRREIAQLYFTKLNKNKFLLPPRTAGSVYLRFNILTRDTNKLRLKLNQKAFYLGNWYSNIIDPKGVNFARIYYKSHTCPRSVQVAKQALNLPTYPSLKESDAFKICEALNSSAF